MSHADVLDLLEASALIPGRLRALMSATTDEAMALRRHVTECEACRRELDAWQAVDESLAAVTPDTLAAPGPARSRILSNVLATGVERGPGRVLGTAPAAEAAGVTPRNPATTPATPTAPVDAPNVGRVWRTPTGQPLPSPAPTPMVASDPIPVAPAPADPRDPRSVEPAVPTVPAVPGAIGAAPDPVAPEAKARRGLRVLTGGAAGDGLGLRVFLAVAAAAVFLFALGAALGGPLGLTGPTTVQDTTARTELERVMGRMADVLQSPGVNVAALTDASSGEPAGAVLLALPDENLLAVATRALPALPEGQRYVCILERDTGFGLERFQVGYMRFAADPTAAGDVAYWLGPLGEDVPADAGAPGDRFLVFREGATDDPPLLTATF